MKTLLLFSILIITLNANELDWVTEQVQAIKPARVGVQKQVLYKLKNPFIHIKEKKEKSVTKAIRTRQIITTQRTNTSYITSPSRNRYKRFNLSIIINKSAMINNKWYKIGDIISGYKIEDIKLSTVLLRKNGKNHVLSTNAHNKNIVFKNK